MDYYNKKIISLSCKSYKLVVDKLIYRLDVFIKYVIMESGTN